METSEKIALFIGASLVLLFVYFMFVGPFTGLYYGYSEGERTGDIYKFSQKGLFWKSWEGEMYLGGMMRNEKGGLELEKFYFSIPADQVLEKQEQIDKLKECARNRNKKCTITYTQWFVAPAKISSAYVVQDVKMVGALDDIKVQ